MCLECETYRTDEESLIERENIKKMRTDILSQREFSRLFLGKIHELSEELVFAEIAYDDLLKRRTAHSSRTDWEEWEYQWCMSEHQKEIKHLKKQIKKFTFYHAMCLGKANEQILDVERARGHPIENLISYAPETKHSRGSVYKCPIHNEKTGSLHVYKQTNTWWCFGCNSGRDSIDLYMKIHGVSFVEAVKQLQIY